MPPLRTTLNRFAAHLADWLFLTAGLTLLALALIIPAWLSSQDLVWQRDLMRLQVERLSEQQARYQEFHEALEADDPVLLERLAFTQLGYQIVGKQVLRLDEAALASEHADMLATSASIDHWLVEPMPKLGVDAPRRQRVDTRLTRLATTPELRVGLIAAAIACLAAGLWPHRQAAESADEATALKVGRA